MKVFGAPGAYKVDWWSPEPGEDWKPVERGSITLPDIGIEELVG